MKKKFNMPDTYVLIVLFVVLAAVLTYVLPAGEYLSNFDEGTGQTVVDASSYHAVEASPINLLEALMAIPQGMMQSGSIIFLVFIIGGAFEVINDTGALAAAIGALTKKFGHRDYLVVPIIMSIMAVLGALGIVIVSVIALIPLGLILARKLRVDPIAGVAIMYLGAYSGFTTSPIYPGTLQLAQSIAQLEPLSGFAFRVVMCVVITVISTLFTMAYVRKVQASPNSAIMATADWNSNQENEELVPFTAVHAVVLVILLAVFAIYAYGAFYWSWGNDHMAAMLLLAAILSGLVTRTSVNQVAHSFINGCKDMVYGALIIGFANGISIILTDGKIIHTVIYYISQPLVMLPSVISANFMLLINLVFNFFVPSGSGQAAVVMPLMAPMSDVVGVSRQIAVLAYQWGDGFSNIIVPTSGVLMGVLGVAKIPFDKWLKYVWPIFLAWVVAGAVAISVAVLIGYA